MSRSSWLRNKACGIDSTYGTSLVLVRMSTTDAYSTNDLSVDILYQYAAGATMRPLDTLARETKKAGACSARCVNALAAHTHRKRAPGFAPSNFRPHNR